MKNHLLKELKLFDNISINHFDMIKQSMFLGHKMKMADILKKLSNFQTAKDVKFNVVELNS